MSVKMEMDTRSSTRTNSTAPMDFKALPAEEREKMRRAQQESVTRLSTPRRRNPPYSSRVMKQNVPPRTSSKPHPNGLRRNSKSVVVYREISRERHPPESAEDAQDSNSRERAEERPSQAQMDHPESGGKENFINRLYRSIIPVEGNDQKEELDRLRQRCRSLGAQLKHTKEEKEQLEHDIRELDEINQYHQADLEAFQIKSFREISSTSWIPLEDDAVQQILNEIHEDLENWSLEFCIQDFQQLQHLSESEASKLVKAVQHFAHVHQESPLEQIRWWAEFQRRGSKKNPTKLLTANLSHQLYDDLLNNPFILADTWYPKSRGQTSAGLMMAYKALKKVSPKQANTWRCQFARTFTTCPEVANSFERATFCDKFNEPMTRYIHQYCKQRVKSMLGGPAKLFLAGALDDDAISQLVGYWERAMMLFSQIQTQMSSLSWVNPVKEEFIKASFNEKYMTPHRSDAFLGGWDNGKVVHSVMTPCVYMDGNENGDDYGKFRVLVKATVLVWGDDELEMCGLNGAESSAEEEL